MSKVRVRAAFRKNRFYGWRITAYGGPGSKIRRGDIVISINHKPIERPGQFMAVWNQLAREKQLVVQLVRQGKPLELRYKIVD